MDHLFWALLFALLAFISLASAGHALVNKRDPRAAMGWVLACITIPLFGALLYWSMGVNRIQDRARRWHREAASHPFSPPVPEPRPHIALPQELRYLEELRSLSDHVVSTPLLPGNSLDPLENGEQAYPCMLQAIEEARHSIHLCTYIFDGDETGRQFTDALIRAAKRGVRVRVIVDSLGEMYSRPTARRLLKGSGVHFGRFLPLRPGRYLNLRNHRKILVVDGRIGFTGGMNIGNRHMAQGTPPVVRDLHFKVGGPVVADLQRTFLDDWRFVTGERLQESLYVNSFRPRAGSALVRAVSDGPDKEFRKLNWIILGAISCAKERVSIVTPYFIPDRPLVSALVTAALRGVSITMVLPGLNNLPFVKWATWAYLWELVSYGIKVYAQPPPFVHTKFMVVDGSWTLIGSANLDPRSLRLNFELNLEVYDLAFGQLMEGRCREAVAASTGITLADLDGRSVPIKLRDGLAKLFSPYL
ncbi:cardiolipin synthase [Geomesophilobacter sediminis]|uniref:Cardiolipin synthase n=1 Tax=Geomesophilobacter sediminis TaxID=2798584 RepID=A0A8J7JJZ1_9BACT|nr:cardiolipin synthase [Geomesophilobacter sediminis]MBJ6724725.1 cardiolipin synthase [Geomesophilobacter sediminis]